MHEYLTRVSSETPPPLSRLEVVVDGVDIVNGVKVGDAIKSPYAIFADDDISH